MKHSFVSAKADGVDTSVLRPSDWNALHVHGRTTKSTNYGLLSTDDVIEATAGATGITLTLPTAVGCAGRTYTIKRVDAETGSPPGVVTVATTSAQTIDGDPYYYLANQWQYVVVYSDGSNWLVIGGN